ncbi:hypothetical protein AS026_10990 [Rhizobium altiplani]|uniref:Uncharacterized protein n=1 Tax=Rhizobium altiplani TaxID=1864509 RepID=A0A120FJG9_9HYPH|nr:hypothetical protein [Rhizobium mesoamericanum]KWV49086.1 hypothetical protein AS026_10990 [Rhizobium altiplani]
MGNHRAILFPAEEGRPAHRFGLLKIPVTALRLSVIISSAKHIFDLAVIADPVYQPIHGVGELHRCDPVRHQY